MDEFSTLLLGHRYNYATYNWHVRGQQNLSYELEWKHLKLFFKLKKKKKVVYISGKLK